MFVTIWMCTQEWSLIAIRATALTFETCHQPLSCESWFTRSITRRSFWLPRSGTRIRIAATAEGEQHGDIEYRAVTIAPHEVERAVVNVLRYFESPGALVFCATRESVRRLTGNLRTDVCVIGGGFFAFAPRNV